MPNEQTEIASQFTLRRNSDGTLDSICLCCYLTAATASNERDLEERQRDHYCLGFV